mmetsp:Transcript_11175/g.68901  ORF Transcript_11175/g.68901 Transcript_11175/m.68901 type:complete len:259 (+) Transcript_11175:2761-3537(+)
MACATDVVVEMDVIRGRKRLRTDVCRPSELLHGCSDVRRSVGGRQGVAQGLPAGQESTLDHGEVGLDVPVAQGHALFRRAQGHGHDARVHVRLWEVLLPSHAKQVIHTRAVVIHAHAHGAVVLVAGTCLHQPPSCFVLQHQMEVLEHVATRQNALQHVAGDVVRQVGHHTTPSTRMRRHVDVAIRQPTQHVGMHQFQPSFRHVAREIFRQRSHQAVVLLHGKHASTCFEQMARQISRSWSDFQHGCVANHAHLVNHTT